MNRLALHESLADEAPSRLVDVAAAAGFTSIGLRVAHSPGAGRWWSKGAGALELHALIDRLLATRISVLDVGRIDLPPDGDEDVRLVLDLAGRLGARHVTVGLREGPESATEAFGHLVQEADNYQVVPLLAPHPSAAWLTDEAATALTRTTGGGLVLALSTSESFIDIDTRVTAAGNRLGYVRLLAEELDAAAEDAVAGLLATVPAHVPIAVGAGAADSGGELVERARRWSRLIDRMLEHPRARHERETRTRP